MTDLMKYSERPFFEGLSRLENFVSSDWAALDVQENDDQVNVILDLPGVKKEDVEIDYQDNILDICATRETERSDTRRSERRWGKIRRTISLPGIQIDDAKAHLEDGVLTISCPKGESAGTTIEID